jgi:hypothetical protein
VPALRQVCCSWGASDRWCCVHAALRCLVSLSRARSLSTTCDTTLTTDVNMANAVLQISGKGHCREHQRVSRCW